MVEQHWIRPRKRRQRAEVVGDEDDGELRRLQGLQVDRTTSSKSDGGSGRVAQAWEGLKLPRQPDGIAGELELGDGGPRPARPGYGFYKIVECVGVVDCARGGWGGLYL